MTLRAGKSSLQHFAALLDQAMSSLSNVAFGSGSGLGLGGKEVCAQARPGVVRCGGFGHGGDKVLGLADDARAYPTDLDVCTVNPTMQDRLYLGLTQWPPLLFTVGFLLGLRLLIRTARRDGMFTTSVARGVGVLGFFLLAGAILVPSVQVTGNGLLLQRLVDSEIGWNALADGWELSWSTLIGAFSLITFGRLLARAVTMRQELDVTV